ncbi:hypothetical protein ACIQ6Y_35455 [Streptomyces sp. NPDC096205]|uniref:hypothetical protein n=1 Tax=Streptomyces sp. NPDC096205 TaxID=3366081 RepID=UPI00382551BE
MLTLLLIGALALALAGCACAIWAERGGPRWAHVVGRATVTTGEVLPALLKSHKRGRRSSSDGD